MKALAASALLLISGCATDDEPLVVSGPTYQYVVSELRIPSNNAMARDNAIDLDDDKVVDNQLGMVFGALAGQGLGVGETAQESVLRGGLLMLAELQTSDFTDTEASGFTTWLGDDVSPTPCLDPTQLSTCGQHLRGTGRFSIEDGFDAHQMKAPIIDGELRAKAVFLPVEIVVDAARPIRLDLRGARVRLTAMSEGHISAVFAGGVTKADVENIIIPEAAANIDRIVQNECTEPPMEGDCGCASGSRSRTLQRLFDDNDDCRVTTPEVNTNSLVQSLLTSDIEIDGQELLSFGVGVELVPASF